MPQIFICAVVWFFYFSISKINYHLPARETFWWPSFQMGVAEGKKRPSPHTLLATELCHSVKPDVVCSTPSQFFSPSIYKG